MVILFAFRSILHSAPPFSVPWKAVLSRIPHLGSLALWLQVAQPLGGTSRRLEGGRGEKSDPSPLGLVSGCSRALL